MKLRSRRPREAAGVAPASGGILNREPISISRAGPASKHGSAISTKCHFLSPMNIFLWVSSVSALDVRGGQQWGLVLEAKSWAEAATLGNPHQEDSVHLYSYTLLLCVINPFSGT